MIKLRFLRNNIEKFGLLTSHGPQTSVEQLLSASVFCGISKHALVLLHSGDFSLQWVLHAFVAIVSPAHLHAGSVRTLVVRY